MALKELVVESCSGFSISSARQNCDVFRENNCVKFFQIAHSLLSIQYHLMNIFKIKSSSHYF